MGIDTPTVQNLDPPTAPAAALGPGPDVGTIKTAARGLTVTAPPPTARATAAAAKTATTPIRAN